MQGDQEQTLMILTGSKGDQLSCYAALSTLRLRLLCLKIHARGWNSCRNRDNPFSTHKYHRN